MEKSSLPLLWSQISVKNHAHKAAACEHVNDHSWLWVLPRPFTPACTCLLHVEFVCVREAGRASTSAFSVEWVICLLLCGFTFFSAGLELTGGANYGKWPNYHGFENLICLHNACLTFAVSLQLFCDDCKSMQKYLNSR